MSKKSLLKSFLKVTSLFAASAALGGGIALGIVKAKNCSDDKQNSETAKAERYNLKTQQQIIADLNVFEDADTSYIYKTGQGDFVRLGNNGQGTKIPLMLNDSFTSAEISEIKETVDEYNEIMLNVNPRYQYEIYMPGQKCDSKVDVKVGLSSEELDERAKGLAKFPYNDNQVWIKVDPNKTNTSDETGNGFLDQDDRFVYTLKHEMLHVLGFDDVYDLDHYYKTSEIVQKSSISNNNTLLRNDCIVSFRLRQFTPTDIANMFLLYYNAHREVNEEEKNDKIEKAKSYLQSYKLKFLEKVNNNFRFIDYLDYPLSEDLQPIIPDFLEFGTIKLSADYFDLYKYELILSNGKYKQIFTSRESGETLEFVNNYYVFDKKIFLYDMKDMNNKSFEISTKCLGYLVMNKNSNGITCEMLLGSVCGVSLKVVEVSNEITDLTKTETELKQVQNEVVAISQNIEKVQSKAKILIAKISNKADKKTRSFNVVKPKESSLEL